MKIKVMITGARGDVGKSLCEILDGLGYVLVYKTNHAFCGALVYGHSHKTIFKS